MDFVWSDEQGVLDEDRRVPQEQPNDEAARRGVPERAEACRPSRLVRAVA